MNDALQRELDYHERLYSGFAQQHFAKPAVRALRAHLAARILDRTGAGRHSRVLSLGCGIGDTEMLIAPHVGELVGIDLSPKAVAQAREDAVRLGLRNTVFVEGTMDRDLGSFDAVIAVFFLHHLPDDLLAAAPARIAAHLDGHGVFFSLDPSRNRLSGRVGRVVVPALMKKYQTEDERELDPGETAALFAGAGFAASSSIYDFGSSPLAGLLPSWRWGYQAARAADDWILRIPALRGLGSNFEILARL